MEIETKAVHSGYSPDPTTNAVAVSIYQTTSYAFDNTQHGAGLFDLFVAGVIVATGIKKSAAQIIYAADFSLTGSVTAYSWI